MSGDADQIFGQVAAVDVVRALMARNDGSNGLDRPVLVVEGARGSGKTALVGALAGKLDTRVPYARVDLEVASRSTSVPDVLSALAFELGRKCPQYGELSFPRFVLGRLVLGKKLNQENRPQARREVTTLLEKQRNIDNLREILGETAGALIDAAGQLTGVPLKPISAAGKRVPGVLITWVIKWAPGRRIVLGSFQNWYGSKGIGLKNDAIDVLVDLNRWGLDLDDEDNRQQIEELLCDAFLADLRAEFHGSTHPFNCVALIDNVDSELGRRFLHVLVRARRRRAAERKLTPDPLTVVATSRGATLADLPAAAIVDLSGTGGVAVLAEPTNAARWWARYRLADLTEDETASMVSALPPHDGNNERLTRMVYELTGGHPASTRLLVDAVDERPEHRDDLAAVLDQLEPGGGPNRRRVEERLRQRLLTGLSDDVSDDLVTCAAARDRLDASRLARTSGLLTGGGVSYEAIKDVLWPVAGGAGPAVLRRLLLRLLARRTDERLPAWPQLFSWLRARCEQETGEAYYALAVGDLAWVTGRMRELLVRDGPVRWLEVLAEVTSAPRRQPVEGDAAPIEQMHTLLRATTSPGQPVDPLARLVSSLWIVRDPLTDSRRASLHRQLAADHLDVARSLDGDADPLLRAADHHSKQVSLWR